MKTRILIVEDETHLAEGLRFNLELEGYEVELAGDGEAALQMLLPGLSNTALQDFALVILDVMLPGIDGFQVATQLRRENQFVPVLMLTARGRPEDVLRGFEAGADDYLPKPFELSILLARVSGLLRRRQWLEKSQRQASEQITDNRTSSLVAYPSALDSFTLNNRTIDFDALELRTPSRTIRLTLMEANLLRYLIEHAGRTVSRKQMLEQVWNLRDDTDTRAIDNFIVRLRRYIESDPTNPKHLLTVRGVGYRLLIDSE